MNESLLSDLQAMQAYFATGATLDYHFRRQQLQRLKEALYAHEQELYEALYQDLKKNQEESWVTELGFVVAELNHALKKLKGWMKPQRVGTNLMNLPSQSYVRYEPLGVVLVIGTWNYPVQLLLNPVVGAIAAGNCVVLKPSEYAPATAGVIQKIIETTFDKKYVMQVQGEGAAVVPALMKDFRFDHVFYTGNTAVGKAIYQIAAEQLVPVTLELGGKSPCIIEPDANIEVSAKRIALTKFSNAGQMCVAPDYLLVHEKIKEPFIKALKSKIEQFYLAEEGDYHFGRIVNERQFHRLKAYLQEGEVLMGGGHDVSGLHIEPTLLVNVSADARVMQDYVFYRYDFNKSDNLKERKIRTQLLYIRQIVTALIIFLTIAAVLLTFSSLRKIGAGLLTGVGIGGIIIGFAAQRSLGNLLAGLQIAFTQPIRIDDAVLIEGEFGRVEEITLTYVVVRIWDERRLILPINYFIEKPFQNWTRHSAELLGTVILYTDYTVPVEELRQELKRLVQHNPLWDGKALGLEVTDTTPDAVQLRALVSARTSGDAWTLRCFVREKLIQFLTEHYPDSLPKTRAEVEPLPKPSAPDKNNII